MPLPERDASRLLVLPRSAVGASAAGAVRHLAFRDLPDLLDPGDVLVLNDTRVLHARLLGERARTGGKVEVLCLEPLAGGAWEALVRSGGRLAPGEALALEGGALRATIERALGDGRFAVRFDDPGQPIEDALERVGRVPLPPYIRRDGGAPPPCDDARRYQTVYAKARGAVAAPTAGLHFTDAVLDRLAARGVRVARLTLHVGIGTFLPIRCSDVREHAVHPERYAVPEATGRAIEAARAAGRRVVACGTTTVRALETLARTGACEGVSHLTIAPPFEFRLATALLTNFHLPRTSLLVLVSAFAGRERVLEAYGEAVRRAYRFYSYGDAMLIV